MPNYSMKFEISEIARLLKVDRTQIKSWVYHFSDYLNPQANPLKGIPRQFSLDDIRVCAYVSMYWEDDPDLENIKYGLNAKDYYHYPFNEIVAQATPLFRDLPEEINENWSHGVVFGRMAEIGDIFTLADSYKLAGDKLVDVVFENGEGYDLICPVIYNYRHATELYLKAIIGSKRISHDLLSLLREFKNMVKAEFDSTPPNWFENIILIFNDFDPNGTTFRYGGFLERDEVFVDLAHMKTLMDWLADSFQKINDRRKA